MSKIKSDIVKELHKPARTKFPRRRTIIKGLDDLWQADLAEFRLYARENKGFKFVLVVIDCFSKYLWTVPLKDKSGKNVADAFKTILINDGRTPKNLQTDQGKEFYNSHFKEVMHKNRINHYSTYTIIKASIAERVIRTIKETIYRTFSLRGKYQWIDVLSEITSNYNKRKHSTTRMQPININEDNESRILKTVYSHIKIAGKKKFNVGDSVRISKQKMLFNKGYTPNWTTELFKIKSIKASNPTVYFLEDSTGSPIQGAFYADELQKAKYEDVYLVEKVLKKKEDKVYVKWLGLDKSQNSWIDKSNVL